MTPYPTLHIKIIFDFFQDLLLRCYQRLVDRLALVGAGDDRDRKQRSAILAFMMALRRTSVAVVDANEVEKYCEDMKLAASIIEQIRIIFNCST